ncbi:hypothetical protein RRG08_011931 [Elysia crispata]|uniref:Uncharacterized protein n=1 Tax=Elysia crispata TaxID=231223 RepID=A0AAE0XVL4_9GAST|nr:hypothetical protein RRG08_011931 [Elysia crispata]
MSQSTTTHPTRFLYRLTYFKYFATTAVSLIMAGFCPTRLTCARRTNKMDGVDLDLDSIHTSLPLLCCAPVCSAPDDACSIFELHTRRATCANSEAELLPHVVLTFYLGEKAALAEPSPLHAEPNGAASRCVALYLENTVSRSKRRNISLPAQSLQPEELEGHAAIKPGQCVVSQLKQLVPTCGIDVEGIKGREKEYPKIRSSASKQTEQGPFKSGRLVASLRCYDNFEIWGRPGRVSPRGGLDKSRRPVLVREPVKSIWPGHDLIGLSIRPVNRGPCVQAGTRQHTGKGQGFVLH